MFKTICAMMTVPLLMLAAGCRTPDPTVDLLESELRWMEDNLYELDNRLDQCYAQLKSARRYNAMLRQELAEERRRPPDGAERDDLGYDLESEEDLYNFKAPVVELGDPDNNEDDVPGGEDDLEAPRERPVPDVELQFPEPEGDRPSREDSARAEFEPRRVAGIVLNRYLTGGYDFDGHPGHEGVMVVIEPQDAAGQYVPMPGELSIEVTDPRRRGIAAEVGKWKFDAVETAAYFKKTLLGRGAHFTLPWPGPPPDQPQLRLTVVYDTVDGRTLRAEKMIHLQTGPPPETSHSDVTARTASWTAERLGDEDPPDIVHPPVWRPTRDR